MTRRKIVLATLLGSTVLGVALLAGLAGHYAVFADDDDQENQKALIKAFGSAKVGLQQGLIASEQEGQPISGKFEVDEGKFQLSVYTVKDGKFYEVLVDHVTGKIANVEPITRADDLAAANSQNAVMANAKTSLKDAIGKAIAEATGFRAVGVVPSLKDSHPIASVLLLSGEQFKTIEERLD